MRTYLEKLGENPTEENLEKIELEIKLCNSSITSGITMRDEITIEREKLYLEDCYKVKNKIIKILGKKL